MDHLFTTLPWPGGCPGRRVCRLGLASRGAEDLQPADVWHALDRGVNFLNWCGTPDYLSRTITQLGARRTEVLVCVQFEARSALDAARELQHILNELQTDYVDVLTFYYVEELSEWEEIAGPQGALGFCRTAQKQGRVGLLGLTTHQRALAAQAGQSGLLDLLMVRYNAAHRGAETEVFPIAQARCLPVVVYTCLRWGALLQGTPDDPPGFVPPRPPAWYRFALQSPVVSVALAAPSNRQELLEDLTVLDQPGPLSPEEFEMLADHGRRVRRHAGSFP